RLLGLLACSSAKTLHHKPIAGQEFDEMDSLHCTVCDSSDVNPFDKCFPMNLDDKKELFATFESILDLIEFQSSNTPRAWGMISLRRILNHSDSRDVLLIQEQF